MKSYEAESTGIQSQIELGSMEERGNKSNCSVYSPEQGTVEDTRESPTTFPVQE